MYPNQIRNDKTLAGTIVQWLSHQAITLASKIGTNTFFKGESKCIINLCFHRGACSEMVQAWNIDLEGNSVDLLSTSTTWDIHQPHFTQHRCGGEPTGTGSTNTSNRPPSPTCRGTPNGPSRAHNSSVMPSTQPPPYMSSDLNQAGPGRNGGPQSSPCSVPR